VGEMGSGEHNLALSRGQWNSRLFEFLFHRKVEQGDAPVSRILVTKEFLAAAAGGTPSQAHEAYSDYIQLFRMPRWEFRNLFDANAVLYAWDRCTIPPFVVQLVFTLVVATADAETIDEGNFRNRMALLRGEPPEIGNLYHLSGLPTLWVALSEWLEAAVAEGGSYRLLQLPDAGHETIIGYSKRLAFPGHRDMQKLGALFDTRAMDSGSPLHDIIDAVSGARTTFSPRFLKEFDAFVALTRVPSAPLYRHPFWSAVASLDWTAGNTEASEAVDVRPRYSIELSVADPWNPVIELLTTLNPTTVSADFELNSLPYPLDGYVASVEPKRDPACHIAKVMLQERCLEALLGYSASYIAKAVTDGLVCFAEDESYRLVSAPTVPREGRAFLLGRSLLLHRLIDYFEEQGLVAPRPVRMLDTNWYLTGPLDGGKIKAISKSADFPFDGFRCFDDVVVRPRIQLHGAVKASGGVLFRRGALPQVYFCSASSIRSVSYTHLDVYKRQP